MFKYKILIAGFLLFSISAVFAQQKSFYVGIVDVETIAKEIPEAVEADKKIKEIGQKMQDTLLTFQQDFEAQYKQYEKQKAMMPADQQQKQEESLRNMQMQMMQYREEKFGTKGELARISEKMLEPIREKVRKAIEVIAKEEKMNLVLDKGSASILYAEDKLDITYRVLDKLKRGENK